MTLNNLLQDINSGKFNLVFLIIFGFLLFHVYYKLTKCCSQNENMGDISDSQDSKIKEAVKQIYLADVEAIRNLSNVAKQLQESGLKIPGNLSVSGSFNYLPRGIIVAWTGDKPPEGWALCDGKKIGDFQTPDLRGRFIRMFSENKEESNGAYWAGVNMGKHNPYGGWKRDDPKSLILGSLAIGQVGGSDLSQMDPREMPSHTHEMVDAGNHSHVITYQNDDWNGRGGGHSLEDDGGPAWNKETSAAGNHKHELKPSGGNLVQQNSPPFYVLAYIVKL